MYCRIKRLQGCCIDQLSRPLLSECGKTRTPVFQVAPNVAESSPHPRNELKGKGPNVGIYPAPRWTWVSCPSDSIFNTLFWSWTSAQSCTHPVMTAKLSPSMRWGAEKQNFMWEYLLNRYADAANDEFAHSFGNIEVVNSAGSDASRSVSASSPRHRSRLPRAHEEGVLTGFEF